MARLRIWLFTVGLALSSLLAAWTLDATPAQACSCLPPHLPTIYNQSHEVLRVIVLQQAQSNQQLLYRAMVVRDFKGCRKFGELVRLTTPLSSATCGQPLQVGGSYLITGNIVAPNTIAFGLCGYNRPWSQLTAKDLKFLRTRMICCGQACTCGDGSKPVNCFADPCQVQSCQGASSCQANYCGGCNAEFFDQNGVPMCLPCASDTDCPFFQQCSAGQCVVGCTDDSDCASSEWCRPTETPGLSQCAPYQQEGQWCGGFTPIWAQNKCAPGLICTDFPPFIADAPGVCRKPCSSNADCKPSQYCSEDGVCRDDGACITAPDCSTAGNDWPKELCKGYATCSDGQCKWNCGTYDMCTDLWDTWFGPCDMVLGYGIIDGVCQTISGCSSLGIPLFDTPEACIAACEKPGDCGPGECIGGSYCDGCLCYAPEHPYSLTFCKCELANPQCGVGECLPGLGYCEGPYCDFPVCYDASSPVYKAMCEGEISPKDCGGTSDCGPGQCIGESYCDSCLCYAPEHPISQLFCGCKLSNPQCGIGECIPGVGYCEGPYCDGLPVCYDASSIVYKVICEGAPVPANCGKPTDCGPGQCIGNSFCDSCLCYAPEHPLSKLMCDCGLLDPGCGAGTCISNGAYCEGPHCSAPVCYAPNSAISIYMCQGGPLPTQCQKTCTPPPPLMRAWWPFDEQTGPTSQELISGQNGQWANGPTPVPGMVAGALRFDGIDDVVVAPTIGFHQYHNLTVDMWIRPETLQGTGTLVSFGNLRYALQRTGTELTVLWQPNPTSFGFTTTGLGLMPNEWAFIAVTISQQGELRIYKNGQLFQTIQWAPVVGSHLSTNLLWHIGNGNQTPFRGIIDELEIFERVLTPGEIAAIHTAGPKGKCKGILGPIPIDPVVK